MRFRLRTLLIVLALAPPVLSVAWFGRLAWHEFRAGLQDKIRLQHQGMADECRRIEKGLPTFTEP